MMHSDLRDSIERDIIKAVLKAAVAKGYTFLIDNGGGPDEHIHSSGVEPTFLELRATGQDRLHILANGTPLGWVLFVYGRKVWEVIAGHSATLDALGILDEALSIAERWEKAS